MEPASSTPTSPKFAGFDAFYARNLPVVYGYLLRLCGGRIDQAQDLTQETWLVFVDHLRAGHDPPPDTGWLIAVARSRYIDQWRRRRRLNRKLALVWASQRSSSDTQESEPSHAELSTYLPALAADHRLVLTLRYIDCLGVPAIAELVERTTSATYSLLARARAELKSQVAGETS